LADGVPLAASFTFPHPSGGDITASGTDVVGGGFGHSQIFNLLSLNCNIGMVGLLLSKK
jgi:hypothetical protein